MLRTLRVRLAEIVQKRDELQVQAMELDKEAENVRATIGNLLPLCGESPDPNDLSGLGFTDAVRQVLILNKEKMSALEVKEALEKKGFSLSGYANPLSSIYKILSRLDEKGEVTKETDGLLGLSVYYKAKRRHVQLFTKRRKATLNLAALMPPK